MIILVGGQRSGSGKTTFICNVLKTLPHKFDVVKITPSEKFPNAIERDESVLRVKGKDTDQFLEYGAKDVLWVHGKRDVIGSLIKEAVNSSGKDVIIEGNSAINFIKPDLSFFVRPINETPDKESAKLFQSKANYTVVNTPYVIVPFVRDGKIYANLKFELESNIERFPTILKEVLNIT